MIYIGNNKINKIGNNNRLYWGDKLIYQLLVKTDEPIIPDEPDVEYQLPDVPFMFNFNAKNYSNGVIPNADGALFEYDCTLSDTNVVDYYGDYLTFNGDAKFSHIYSSSSNNPFNRSGNEPMTIICKSKIPTGTEQHILANRGIGYNWMVRIGDTFNNINQAWLHTSKSSAGNNMIRVPITVDVPNIVAYRCLNDGNGYAQNYTTGEIGVTTKTSWGSNSDEINLFYGGYFGEIFLGDFYWMYCSLEQLTDEQIQQVINYNENMKIIDYEYSR